MIVARRTLPIGSLVVLVLVLAAACGSITPTIDATEPPEPATSTPVEATLAPTPTPMPTQEPTDVAVIPEVAQPPTVVGIPISQPAADPAATPSPTLTTTPTAPPPVVSPVVQLPDIAGVVELVRPAVVSVVSEVLVRDFFGRLFRDSQSGSGVIFDAGGYIFTNNHVVENANAVTVTLDDGSQFDAEVVGTDPLTDLAVLKIEGEDHPVAALADQSGLRVGDWVIAIGNALALPGGPTVTVGVVSALERAFLVKSDLQLYGLIQTDASINPGNSGGPLLNLKGEVVGINTAVARGDDQGRNVEGIGFAIGMDTAAPVAQQLVETGFVQWPYLGVGLDDLDPEKASQVGVPIREGVLITSLEPGGPAWTGGIQAGDVVVALDEQDVATIRDLIRILRQGSQVGDEVEVGLFREQQQLTLTVTLGTRPPV